MATKVLVPRLGESVDEVIVTKWLKQVGDSINELEPLLEVNTDKVDTEIPAPISGVLLNISIQEGVTARVGEVLALIGQRSEANADQPAQDGQPAAPQKPRSAIFEPHPVRTQTLQTNGSGFISPVVAKIAGEFGVDLRQVTGTGLGGRITKDDVLAFVRDTKPVDVGAVEPVKQPIPSVSTPLPQSLADDTIIKHSLMRKSIAERMLASQHTSPHVLTVMEVDMSRVLAHRAAHKDVFAQTGVNLTYTAYFLSAIVAGLKAFPMVNSSWSDEGVIVHAGIHLGMATSLGEAGLIVPVIKGADSLSLLGMARAVNDLAERARSKKLEPDEVRGGTFTLTNHGVSGSLFTMPIINQPQCGILGVGALQKRAIVVTDAFGNDALAIRPMLYLSLVFDHRKLDGASADWFLAKVKETH